MKRRTVLKLMAAPALLTIARPGFAQAKDKIERSLSQNPRNANAHAAAGLLYSRLNDIDKADSHFDRPHRLWVPSRRTSSGEERETP